MGLKGAPESFGENLAEKIAKAPESQETVLKNAETAEKKEALNSFRLGEMSLASEVLQGLDKAEAEKIAAQLKEDGPDSLTDKQQAEIAAARSADQTETVDYKTTKGFVEATKEATLSQFGAGFATQMAAMEAYADL